VDRSAGHSWEHQLQDLDPQFIEGWRKLPSYLRFRFSSLSEDEVQDVASDALMSVLAAVGRMSDKGASIEYPMAYLRATADRSAYVLLRKKAHLHLDIDDVAPIMSDDAAAAAFNGSATSIDIKLFMRQLADDDDESAYKVLSYLLDEIQQTGRTPTSREIGAKVGLSHTGVAKALQRIRSRFLAFYIDDE
jgi:DNA-directed RNA polymerase specialized sigma24 family protein